MSRSSISTPVNRSILGSVLYPISGAEQTAAASVNDLSFYYGDIRRYGAAVDGVTDDTAAVQSAIDQCLAGGEAVYLPPGETVVSGVEAIKTDAGFVQGLQMRGEGALKSIIVASALATTVLDIDHTGVSGFITQNRLSDFGIDMSAQSNVAASVGTRINRSFNNNVKNVKIIPPGSNARTLFVEGFTYTSRFESCDLGSVSGVVDLRGTASDNVTTVTFSDCQFGQLILQQVRYLTCCECAWQGNLDKVIINDDVTVVRLYGNDVEGAGVFLRVDGTGGNVRSISSWGNGFVGFSGTYITGEANLSAANDHYLLDYNYGQRNKMNARFAQTFLSDQGLEQTARASGYGIDLLNSATGDAVGRFLMRSAAATRVRRDWFNDPALHDSVASEENVSGGAFRRLIDGTERSRLDAAQFRLGVPQLRLNGATGPVLRVLAGSPEGVLAAPVGSIAVSTGGGAGTTLYVKETGTGATGWVGK